MTRHSSRRSYSRTRSTRLLQSLMYQGSYNIPTTAELIHYDKQQVTVKNIDINHGLTIDANDTSLSWFKIVGFSNVEAIASFCNGFGIQRFDLKDLLSNMNITKIVAYPETTFIMMSGCLNDNDGNIQTEQIAFILGKNFVVSFQEAPSPVFDDVIRAIKDSSIHLRDKGADYLLYILLNSVHNVYIDTIGNVFDKVEQMENELIEQNETGRWVMSFFRDKRKDYQLLWRSIIPLREEFNNLLHNTNNLIAKNNIIFFNDFDDRVRTTFNELEILNESIDSIMNLYFNNNNLKMNDIIKRLTIVSTIFIPLTFMVGVWGMNFRFMPELDWKYGYLLAWGVMFVVAIIAIFFLKKKKWF